MKFFFFLLLCTYKFIFLPIIKCELDSIFYLENFNENVIETGKWIKSKIEKYKTQKVLIKPSIKAANGFENDNGLRLADEMKYYGIGTLFNSELKTNGKDIIIQYGNNFIIFYSILYLCKLN